MRTNSILPANRNLIYLFLTAIIFLLVFRLGYLPLKFEEPRRALVSTEMIINDNFWVPTINGEFYYNKPPLFNWLLVGFYKLFGFHDWTERLPTLLSILGIAFINFLFFRPSIGKEVSALSSLFFVLSGHMMFYFSFQGEIDMTYSFVVYLQVISIFYFFQKRQLTSLYLVSYLLMTIGFLMKGIPSIAFQGLTLVGIFSAHRRFGKLFHYSHFIAIALSILCLYGYFFAYGAYNNPELLLAKLLVESASRTTDSGSALDYLLQLVRLPFLLILIMLPGSFILLFARYFKWTDVWKNQWVKYCTIFILFNILIYWISPGTRDRYLYMFLPFLYNILFYLGTPYLIQFQKPIRNFALVFVGIVIVGFSLLPFVRSDISILYSILTIALLGMIGFFTVKRQIHPVLAVLLLMMTLRFYYDQIVFPIRAMSPDNLAAKSHAKEILSITKGRKIYFVGDVSELKLKLPFRDEVLLHEIERLPYQFSYYYSSEAGSIVQWVDEIPEDAYYIIGANRLNEYEPEYSFDMENKSFVLLKSN